jgi:hypothetical protein
MEYRGQLVRVFWEEGLQASPAVLWVHQGIAASGFDLSGILYVDKEENCVELQPGSS